MTGGAAVSRWIGSANAGYARYAQQELVARFGEVGFQELIPGELFLASIRRSEADVARLLRGNEPVFLRHIHPVQTEFPASRGEEDLLRLQQWLESAGPAISPGDRVGVQARRKPETEYGYTPYAVKEALDRVLTERFAAEPVISGPDKVVSVYMGESSVYAGVSAASDNLSDWNGGMIRFKREDGFISRAKFKLLEAEVRFGLDWSAYSRAVDLGAAPGGWTSLLLERGLRVTAIDPGELDPSLTGHPNLTYHRRKAGEVKMERAAYDLLVSDMSWDPRQSAKLVAEIAPAIRPGGTALMTLKLLRGKPFQSMREVEGILAPALRIVKAKQLFHNRDELTLLLTRPSDS
ncbi:SAM-dependent methyltransferase [Paenibacillus thermoaerophilus]